jgi:hypothetical protein
MLHSTSFQKQREDLALVSKPSLISLATSLRCCVEVEDLSSSIITALWADPVRQHLLFAVRTLHQVGRADGIVRPTAITPPLAQFTLW